MPPSTLVMVAGSRWTVEELFQSSKTLAGLDEHQVRRWNSWHRWVTMAMLAHAFLPVTAARERRDRAPADDGTSLDELIPLTCNESQRLFTPCSFSPSTTPRTDGAGPPRDDATEPAPAAAATAVKPPFSHKDPHLRLEYEGDRLQAIERETDLAWQVGTERVT